jgi:hypothetical protein
MSITDYAKLRERVMKRNPERVAHELEQASQWSLRVAERKLEKRSQRSTEEKSSG